MKRLARRIIQWARQPPSRPLTFQQDATMNRLLPFVVVGLILLLPAAPRAEEIYGAGTTLQEKTKISDILARPDAYLGQKVLVEGTVVAVCAKRGCWLELASDRAYQKMRMKVDDGVIVFPMSARGKTALVEGIVEELRFTKEEAVARARHYAEESGRPFDPASVQGPFAEYRVKATGAVIR